MLLVLTFSHHTTVEKASIDECFIDLTQPVKRIILERHPHLRSIEKDNFDNPLPSAPSSNWKEEDVGYLISVPNEGDSGESREEQQSWHDYALSIAGELMQRVRTEIRTTLGYTTSAVRWSNLSSSGTDSGIGHRAEQVSGKGSIPIVGSEDQY